MLGEKSKWVKRQVWFLVRHIGFITISFLWPIILLPFCKLTALLHHPLFDFVFFVYPGSIGQIKACVPLWYRNIRPAPSVVGIMSKGKKGGRGLVMAAPWTMDEMENKDHFLESSVKKVERVAKFIGAKTIALGGRIVTVLFKRSYRFELSTVPGDKGAVYTVSSSMHQALKSANLEKQGTKIGILGYGFLGSQLGTFLNNSWQYDIVAVDPRFAQPQDQGRIRLTPNPSEIASCDLVVVLTPKGEQIEDEIQYFKPGVIVVDDTYPSLPKKLISVIEKKGGRVVRAAVRLEGVIFWPKLPKWELDWIPGCCVEAMVSAMTGDVSDRTQEEFNILANQMGFEVIERTKGSWANY